MKLRSHQIQALASMVKHDKGQIIVPTGGGKTMCMIEDAKRIFSQNSVPKKQSSQTICNPLTELLY